MLEHPNISWRHILHNKATEELDSNDSTSTPQGDGALSPASSGIFVEDEQSEAPRSNTLSVAPEDKRFRDFLKKGYVMLAVVLVVVGGFLYWVAASLDPDIGISGLRARTVARSAAHHLSSSPEVISAKVSYAYAASGYGPIAQVKARLKDETSVDQAAELLASIHRKADSSQVPLSVTLSWRLNGTDISVNFSCDDSPDNIRATTQRELTLVGKAKSVTRGEPDGSIHADYGTVDAVPTSITEPTSPDSYKTFTLNNWNVTYSPAQDGSYSNPPNHRPHRRRQTGRPHRNHRAQQRSPVRHRPGHRREQRPHPRGSSTRRPRRRRLPSRRTHHTPAQRRGKKGTLQRRPLDNLHLQQRHLGVAV